jgi:hypothetical protein
MYYTNKNVLRGKGARRSVLPIVGPEPPIGAGSAIRKPPRAPDTARPYVQMQLHRPAHR